MKHFRIASLIHPSEISDKNTLEFIKKEEAKAYITKKYRYTGIIPRVEEVKEYLLMRGFFLDKDDIAYIEMAINPDMVKKRMAWVDHMIDIYKEDKEGTGE